MTSAKPSAAALVAAAFVSGGLGAGGLGVAGMLLALPTSQAQPECSPANYQEPRCAPPEGPPSGCDANDVCAQLWCPGSGMSPIPKWDMNVCHTFYFDPNAPLTKPIIIAGQPPGPPRAPQPPCIPLINCLPGL
ncbi:MULTISPECIES: hypothetical protein [unclassified Mycobacterium]|uniref:hypothetical protein n=1 Tax=unclassified Mycobacterium TaxID=2642494 RepID=UPI0029C7CAA6|nr:MULTISPECIES: hypothetical protein [unclassified Mycobacterium]